MGFPLVRMRRMRRCETIRSMVRETHVSVKDLVYPMFVQPGNGIITEVPSMPNVYRYSVDKLLGAVEEVVSLGIPALLLFGIPEVKDERASSAYSKDGVVQRAVRQVKRSFGDDIIVITDVCLCSYTSHGHCGIVSEDGVVQNDATLEVLKMVALSHAEAGADIVAPSDMMDGRVGAIRRALDGAGYQDVPIMAYSAKYASAFYGPFREAAESTPQFGDRTTYQMAPTNVREALREVELDIVEGADIVMVKPALTYLDVLAKVKEAVRMPVAAYSVSGEYSMIKAAARMGWLDEKRTALEVLTAIKRAGADIIITYFAKDVAKWIDEP